MGRALGARSLLCLILGFRLGSLFVAYNQWVGVILGRIEGTLRLICESGLLLVPCALWVSLNLSCALLTPKGVSFLTSNSIFL